MVEEEDKVEEMMIMMNLKKWMLINVILVADIIEEATMRRGLDNKKLPCQNLMEDLILKLISHGS
jgi:hypothetical protein